jgi:hypothetical protein
LRRKSKGCSQKTSGRSYSLKHPVARHFVWPLLVQVVCRPQALQNTYGRSWQPCRNCAGRERFTPALPRMGLVAKMQDSNEIRTPFSGSDSSDIIAERFFHVPTRIAPLAQLDRASGYEPEGREFESLRAHHLFNHLGHRVKGALWLLSVNCP